MLAVARLRHVAGTKGSMRPYLAMNHLAEARSVSENSSFLLLNSLEKEHEGVRIIRNHGENISILSSRTRFAFTSEPARMVAG